MEVAQEPSHLWKRFVLPETHAINPESIPNWKSFITRTTKEHIGVYEDGPSGFIDSLKESKLLSAEEIDRVADAASTGSEIDGPSFAQSLVATGLLTSYQMEVVCNRKFEDLWIGNYEVLDRLGAGGGHRFKARHLE